MKFVAKILYLSAQVQKTIKMATKKNDWKERLNIVYSTNPDFQYSTD